MAKLIYENRWKSMAKKIIFLSRPFDYRKLLVQCLENVIISKISTTTPPKNDWGTDRIVT